MASSIEANHLSGKRDEFSPQSHSSINLPLKPRRRKSDSVNVEDDFVINGNDFGSEKSLSKAPSYDEHSLGLESRRLDRKHRRSFLTHAVHKQTHLATLLKDLANSSRGLHSDLAILKNHSYLEDNQSTPLAIVLKSVKYQTKMTDYGSYFTLNDLATLKSVILKPLIVQQKVGLDFADLQSIYQFSEKDLKQLTILFVIVEESIESVLLAIDQLGPQLCCLKTLVVELRLREKPELFVFDVGLSSNCAAAVKSALADLPLKFHQRKQMAKYLKRKLAAKADYALKEASIQFDRNSTFLFNKFFKHSQIHLCYSDSTVEMDPFSANVDEISNSEYERVHLNKFPFIRAVGSGYGIYNQNRTVNTSLVALTLNWTSEKDFYTCILLPDTSYLPNLKYLSLHGAQLQSEKTLSLQHCRDLKWLKLREMSDLVTVQFGAQPHTLNQFVLQECYCLFKDIEQLTIIDLHVTDDIESMMFRVLSERAQKVEFFSRFQSDPQIELGDIFSKQKNLRLRSHSQVKYHVKNWFLFKSLSSASLLETLHLICCHVHLNPRLFPNLRYLTLVACYVNFRDIDADMQEYESMPVFEELEYMNVQNTTILESLEPMNGIAKHKSDVSAYRYVLRAPKLKTLMIKRLIGKNRFVIDDKSCPLLQRLQLRLSRCPNWLVFDEFPRESPMFPELEEFSLETNEHPPNGYDALGGRFHIERLSVLELPWLAFHRLAHGRLLSCQFASVSVVSSEKKHQYEFLNEAIPVDKERIKEQAEYLLSAMPANKLLMIEGHVVRSTAVFILGSNEKNVEGVEEEAEKEEQIEEIMHVGLDVDEPVKIEESFDEDNMDDREGWVDVLDEKEDTP